jgi:hypothetical protein
VAVGLKAIEQGLARIKPSRTELIEQANRMIKRAREQADILMSSHLIPAPPEE